MQYWLRTACGAGDAMDAGRWVCPAQISTLEAAVAIQPPITRARIEVSRRIASSGPPSGRGYCGPESGRRQVCLRSRATDWGRWAMGMAVYCAERQAPAHRATADTSNTPAGTAATPGLQEQGRSSQVRAA